MTVFAAEQQAAKVPGIVLSDGNVIPQVGLGVLRIDDEGVVPVVKSALELGYRHIDGAAGYNNEAGLGRALAQSGWNGKVTDAVSKLADERGVDAQQLAQQRRAKLWVTTKLKDSEQGYDSCLCAFERQLGLLGLDYVDMYMIHWPTPFDWRSSETWRAMRELQESGRVRTLGVCNFMPADLERLYNETGQWPAVNQIELHPTWQQREVVAFCKQHNIAVEAYSPMARGADLNAGDGTIERIAAAHQVSPAQVILRWHIENGTIIIPKSVHAERQRQNLDLFNFALTPEEHAAIDALDGPTRAGHDPATFTYA
ncbi:2,5-diketo-D-gluconic acid reductase [Bifidobacterium dolichotidis]|uniref:2,5-diketo-D-gluconic acid reductase n=1 Tax=Bifidobacterium dolichotidis TaxID=2306976 RepID=A0A430FRN6_9BIFI|nr:aldo/keto reductase [Bifidobacterium dolichotidis]RSX55517.1 2,5-diketo-D-gluconic acid reductase [Bifidobacterium dolichotidis]